MQRILLVNEANFFKTGYSKYGRELMQELYKTGKYELAELGTHACPWIPHHVQEVNNTPWKFYWNMPNKNGPEWEKFVKSGDIGKFGGFKFEETCIDFQPDCVFSIRDFWFETFIMNSPYRPIYKMAWMSPVDSAPQNPEWLAMAKQADACFTYNDWSKKVLEDEGINVLNSCPPSCSPEFKPIDKTKVRQELGLDENITILGFVARNQRRKLFNDLFLSLRDYLNKSQRDDVYLLIHSSYPDKGWDFPQLLLEHQLTSKVLFTYICSNCNYFWVDFYRDVLTVCPHCKNLSAHLPNVKFGIDDERLAKTYNCMDLYVQYHNSEGFGIPIIEAAACSVPVMSVDYSAQSDIVRKLRGIPIPVKHLSKECESGAYRAIPDNDSFVSLLEQHLNKNYLEQRGKLTQIAYKEHYQWTITASRWMEYFDSVPQANWKQPPRILQPSQQIPQCNNRQFVRWLITDVLREPSRLGSFLETRLIRDLSYGHTKGGLSGVYLNEDSQLFEQKGYQDFGRKEAYETIAKLANYRNQLEYLRGKKFGLI